MAAPGGLFVFVVVGKGDRPLYEADLSESGAREDSPHYDQFLLHQSLDAVEESSWRSSNLLLKSCDAFRDFLVSAFCTAGRAKLLLLHRNRGSSEGIRAFFQQVHELLLRVFLNPLYEHNGLITSSHFDKHVRLAAKKHLHH